MTDWRDPAFLAGAHDWVRSHVTVTGAIEQPHVQWWSTVLRVPTSDGPVWFKAVGEGATYEPPLTEMLARLRPRFIPDLIAIDDERGWMLMRDGGIRLRELGDELVAWETILPAYAELQLATARHVDQLLELAVPDERLEGLPERLAGLLGDDAFLMLDQPDGLTSAERDRLVAQLPEIASLGRELAGTGIPATIQHDDLHGGNVLVRDGRSRVFDWGDACVSHPLHSLTVLLRATAWKLDLEPGGPELLRMRDAYVEPFTSFGNRRDLIEAAELAYRTGTIARSLAWFRSLKAVPPEARAEDLDSIPYGLQRFLEGGPIGSWRW